MKQELDELLCTKYPKMMVNRNSPMQETCMCWGFECGDGWYNILNQLMGNIQHHIDWRNKKEEVVAQVTLDQVKEKFGGLRFYINAGSDQIHTRIREAEDESYLTCEKCGEPGEHRTDRGWWTTLCESFSASIFWNGMESSGNWFKHITNSGRNSMKKGRKFPLRPKLFLTGDVCPVSSSGLVYQV